jgi:hypothetical protein
MAGARSSCTTGFRPENWTDPHLLDVAVILLGEHDEITVCRERLVYGPFTHDDLAADLRTAGLEVELSTHEDTAERYLVTARNAP